MLWDHRPLTDFWRIGRGISRRLEQYGITTMGDVARCSIDNEELLYSMFGVNAELLIDHAWGWLLRTLLIVTLRFHEVFKNFIHRQPVMDC